MPSPQWHDLGPIAELSTSPLRTIVIGRTRIALSCRDGQFGAISGACNHAGGPLGDGQLDGDYVVCPWHHW
ncbi:MAG: Rieske (2Fe-2S) protein, partial [Gemmatimonadota bacterium]|nr:Rieske (2Fe-2S) protein [Gemmatimonadota bacterium]